MNPTRPSIRPIVWALVSAAVVLRLAFVWSGLPEAGVIADDAFYYFTIAHNVVSGAGPTFDGLTPTNGYHPLWLLTILPAFGAFASSLWIPVRVALTLCALFDAVTGLLLYDVLRRCGMERWALWTLVFWLFSPVTVMVSMTGMDASLATLLVVASLWWLVRVAELQAWGRAHSAVAAGLLVGLAGLSRTDYLPTLGLAVFAFALVTLRRRYRVLTTWTLTTAGIAALVVSPWFIWNYLNFHSFVQVSGAIKYHAGIIGSLPVNWHGLVPSMKTLAHATLAPVVFPMRWLAREGFVSPGWWPPLALVFLVTTYAPALLLMRRRPGDTPAAGPVHAMVAFCAVFVAVHITLFGFIWRAYATWYALPIMAFSAVAFGFSARAVARSIPRRVTMQRAAVVAVVLFHGAVYTLFLVRVPLGAAGIEHRIAPRLDEVASRYPGGVALGSFNAGRFGYIATAYPSVTVVNLDGLVNNEVYYALRDDRYLEYILDTVDAFIEDPSRASMYLDAAAVDELSSRFRRLDGQNLWLPSTGDR